MQYHPVFAEYPVYVHDKLLVLLFVLVVVGVAALVAAKFFIGAAYKGLVAEQAVSFHTLVD
jgi:cytochrome b